MNRRNVQITHGSASVKAAQIKQAQQQLAAIWQCEASVFAGEKHHYISTDQIFFEIVSFGGNAVIRGDSQLLNWCRESFESLEANEIVDGESLFALESKLREHGYRLGGEHVRYLYQASSAAVPEPPLPYRYELFDQNRVAELHQHRSFDNALNFKRDVLAYAAYSGDELVALAGADDYFGKLWQIGIDTVESHRHSGLGSYLVAAIAEEIKAQGAIPFYTTWSANLASTRLALKAGFFPAWINYFAEPLAKE